MDNKERFIEIFTSQIHRPAPTTTAATPAGWWNIA